MNRLAGRSVCRKKNPTEDNDEKDPYQCCISISSGRNKRVRGAEQERRWEEARFEARGVCEHWREEAGWKTAPQEETRPQGELEHGRRHDEEGQQELEVVRLSPLICERVGPAPVLTRSDFFQTGKELDRS